MDYLESDILNKIVFISSFHVHSNSGPCFICNTIIGQKEGRALAETGTEANRDKDTSGVVIFDEHLT